MNCSHRAFLILANVHLTFANIGECLLEFRQYWRMSTRLSPVYPLNIRQLAKVRWTLANIPTGLSPIIGESLIGELPASHIYSPSFLNCQSSIQLRIKITMAEKEVHL